MKGRAGTGFVVLAVLVAGCGSEKNFEVPSGSMLPTIEIGETISVDESAYESTAPEVGDIVVVHPPVSDNRCAEPQGRGPCAVSAERSSEDEIVKRISASPGDTVSIERGRAIVNGEDNDIDSAGCTGAGSVCNLPEEITVPEGAYFVLGDNRGSSSDSRIWGPVPLEWITGRVESIG